MSNFEPNGEETGSPWGPKIQPEGQILMQPKGSNINAAKRVKY